MRKYKAMKILVDENGMVEDIYLNIQQTFEKGKLKMLVKVQLKM